jgi:hypothetical protein
MYRSLLINLLEDTLRSWKINTSPETVPSGQIVADFSLENSWEEGMAAKKLGFDDMLTVDGSIKTSRLYAKCMAVVDVDKAGVTDDGDAVEHAGDSGVALGDGDEESRGGASEKKK